MTTTATMKTTITPKVAVATVARQVMAWNLLEDPARTLRLGGLLT